MRKGDPPRCTEIPPRCTVIRRDARRSAEMTATHLQVHLGEEAIARRERGEGVKVHCEHVCDVLVEHVVAEGGGAPVGEAAVHEQKVAEEAELADGKVRVVDGLRAPRRGVGCKRDVSKG